jgi:hypothetical protein
MNAPKAIVLRFGRHVAGMKGVQESDDVLNEDMRLTVRLKKLDLKDFLKPKEDVGVHATGRTVFQSPEFILGGTTPAQPQLTGELLQRPAFALARFAERTA